MSGKRIVYYILATFIAGCLLLIYIQYNSAKSINTLIKSNEILVDEFKVNGELSELEKDVISIESKIRGAVTTKDSSYIIGMETEIMEVEGDLKKLQKISDNDSSVKYIDILDDLVHEKLLFSMQILDSFHTGTRFAAADLIATERGKILLDSIRSVTHIINSTRNKQLAGVTISIDESGKKAQRFGAVLIGLVLISGAGLFWYIINIIRNQRLLIEQLDISEKKVREVALVKEKFMTNMSHEIRTPLNAILGFTNLLQRKVFDDETKEYVQAIQKSGENLLNIINDILDLSKIESGMMRIERAPFSIRGLMQSVETMFKIKADDKRLTLSVDIDERVPDILEGDATRLTQILVNLIGNSLKFTSKGNILIRITNEGTKDSMAKIGFNITDTGIGIDKDKLNIIFERFQQAEDSVTRKYGGTGLGLSIVKDLVLLLNGTINVESEAGKGTVFTLVIPYKISGKHVNIDPSPEKSEDLRPDFEDVYLLVVEDNEINQSLIKHLFKSWQLNFDLANNGREAIDKLQTKKYNLILMDIQMPEMDGYTASRIIRNLLKLDIPIIAMTAHAMAGEKEKCISYGMNDYISKPIREEQLHKLISQFTRSIPECNSPKELMPIKNRGDYKTINLQYMKAVSFGNTGYEKTVTEQFIEAIPDDLMAMQKAWQSHDMNKLKQLAHNMKTTISVMGLNDTLEPYLDAIEFEQPGKNSVKASLHSVQQICNDALVEAKLLLKTFE